MSRSVRVILIALATACASTVLASAQATSSSTDNSATGSSGPVALVYVSSNPSGSTYQIQAYFAAPNGALTAGQKLDVSTNLSYMAVNRHDLFATDGVNVDSFAISPSDGALTEVSSINAQALGGGCGGPITLFLDRTGETLYDVDYLGGSCANNAYQTLAVESEGTLNYMGAATVSPAFTTPLSFLGNNKYAYSATCYHFDPEVYGFARNADRSLTELNIVPAMPPGKTGQEYCPWLAAADATNHLAVGMSPIFDSNWQPAGPNQLGVYTADSEGNLTTISTHANMPVVAVGNVNAMEASPSGKLLAVAGIGGLQVFHFNGAAPITRYTGMLTTDTISEVFWDNSNHLYGLSPSAGKLYVFTVTPTSVKQAPGSPYAITQPTSLAVLP